MAKRIIIVDDEELFDAEGNLLGEDVTEEIDEICDEHDELSEYVHQVEASFNTAVQEQVELSLARQGGGVPILAKGAKKTASASRTGTAVENFNPTSKPIRPRASAGASSAGISGVGKQPGAKAASVGKHLIHAAKVVGRHAFKHKAALAAGAVAGAATGAVAGHMAKRGQALSQPDLSLENEELPEGFDPNVDYSDDQLSTMTVEQAEQLIDQAVEDGEIDQDDYDALEEIADEEHEISRRNYLRDFVQNRNFMGEDAARRSTK